MLSEKQSEHDRTLRLMAKIVVAHASRSYLPASSLPKVIVSVYGALTSIRHPPAPAAPAVVKDDPKRTVFPDYIISLEDGRYIRSMKKHLAARGMTPDEYRVKWGLAADYPMVAPNYSAERSAIAKRLGFGRNPAT